MGELKLQPTMWAAMKPDVYGGNNCDGVIPRWNCCADGDKGGDDFERVLKLDARSFPPGTKIVISEPRCPKCDEQREPKLQSIQRGPLYSGPCRCGFDWDAWVLDNYS